MIARIGIGAATSGDDVLSVWVSNAGGSPGKLVDHRAPRLNAPRAATPCLRIRVCAGGSDVGRNGSHPREGDPRALDNVVVAQPRGCGRIGSKS